jgi:predicted RNA-binding Zn-ribbon protein involved in translation (DUF1610 family)
MMAMGKEPLKDDAEVEVICPRCGYHLGRTAGRLRRDTPVVCPNCGEQVVPARPTASLYARNRGQSGHEPRGSECLRMTLTGNPTGWSTPDWL